jgi:hypothetical protein
MSRLWYQCLWVRTCGFPLSVAHNENWVGSVVIVTSLRTEDWRIVVASQARVKPFLFSKILNRLFTHQLSYSERKNGLFLRELRGWSVKMTNYLHPVWQLRNYSLPNNFIHWAGTTLALIRRKCGRNKERGRTRRRWIARLKGMYT